MLLHTYYNIFIFAYLLSRATEKNRINLIFSRSFRASKKAVRKRKDGSLKLAAVRIVILHFLLYLPALIIAVITVFINHD